MLANTDAIATLPVRNIEAARKFYEGTLGLKQTRSEEPGVLGYKSGKASILVYESQYAGTNKATAVTWVVEDLGSTNGTFLGRSRVGAPTPVEPGTPVRIGRTVLELRR